MDIKLDGGFWKSDDDGCGGGGGGVVPMVDGECGSFCHSSGGGTGWTTAHTRDVPSQPAVKNIKVPACAQRVRVCHSCPLGNFFADVGDAR